MSPRRAKTLVLLTGLALAGLTLIAWTQTWFVFTLAEKADSTHPVTVEGTTAAPALAALGLAGLALVAALTLAGPFFRRVLGVLELMIGASVVISSVTALANPVAAGAELVTKATGVAGAGSIENLVTSVSQGPWPWVALALGVLLAALGVVITLIRSRWPDSSRRFQAVRSEPGESAHTPATDWDALSNGSDPTSR